MEALVNDIRANFPSIDRLDYIAQQTDNKVHMNGKYVGINDKSEGGYIRLAGDPDIINKNVASCVVVKEITQPYSIVLGFRKWKMPSYVDKLLSVLMKEEHRTEVSGMVLLREDILLQETGNDKSYSDKYQLIKINFTQYRQVQSDKDACVDLECLTDC